MSRTAIRLGLGSALAVGAVLLLPVSSQAAGDEQISSYDVKITMQQSGSMHVVETIGYDFGSAERHGIVRELVTKQPLTDNDKQDQVYPISNIKISSPSGASAKYDQTTEGYYTDLKIGDANQTVDGQQTYVIAYDLQGTLNRTSVGQELYWNAIGTGWSVPIAQARITVTGPAAITQVRCFAGSSHADSTDCPSTLKNGVATYSATGLQANQGVTVDAAFPDGTFASTGPILKDRWSLARAFSATPVTIAGFIVLFLGIAGTAVYLVRGRGRDEQYLGVTPGLEPGYGQDVAVRKVGWSRDPIAVQFTPPTNMRPGELGTLIDEQANVVDVTATIVDLAVRGYLKIEEIPKEGWFGKPDWRLSEVSPAPPAALLRYEQKLFNAIFDGRSDVLLSDLKTTFASDLSTVQSMLYDDVTDNGWFRGNPSSVRQAWAVGAGAFTIAAGALTVWLAAISTYALIPLGLTLGALVLLAVSRQMPARTAKGTALLAQAKGFELYLTKAEANQIKWEEGQDIFSRYLPFAIVFGVADRWAKVFDDLAKAGANLPAPGWYSGTSFSNGVFNYLVFSSIMDNFATTTTGSIAAAAPSSSGGSGFGGGGFAGGGGGGGGGGSW